MLIDLRSKFPNLTGKEVENALGLADITVNKNSVPFDTRSPFQTSGFRVGTAAITTRGFSENDCLQVVEWINFVIHNIENTKKIDSLKTEVNQFMQQFPLYE